MLAIQRNAISSLILLYYTLWKKPVQNGKVNTNWSKLPEVESRILEA
jgi:hypothetical protein